MVELTTQLLIPSNILWLPLCRINKFGLNTLPSKTVMIPYTCGLSAPTKGGESRVSEAREGQNGKRQDFRSVTKFELQFLNALIKVYGGSSMEVTVTTAKVTVIVL